MRTLKIEKSRARNYYSLPRSAQERIKATLEDIATEEKPSDHPKVEILKGVKETVYRVRVGEYRAVFTVRGTELRVWKVANRRTVYDGINNLKEKVSV